MSVFDWLKLGKKGLVDLSGPSLPPDNITSAAQLANYLRGGSGTSAYAPYSRSDALRAFVESPVSHQCINLLATSCAAIDLMVVKGDEEVDDRNDPLKRLLHRPNPTTGWARMATDIYTDLALFGNAYITRSLMPNPQNSDRVNRFGLLQRGTGQLKRLPAIEVTVHHSGGEYVDYYEHIIPKGGSTRYLVDQQTGVCDELLHLKLTNPIDRYQGLAPAASAWLAILNHVGGLHWNLNSLENNAIPSMVLTVNEGSTLTPEQVRDITDSFNRLYQGSKNAGKVAVLDQMTATPLSIDPQKMAYIEGQNLAARNIAQAFQVPSMLLGIPGDNTYANYEQAVLSFYQSRVFNLVDYVLDELTNWLSPAFPDYRIEYDADSVAALDFVRSTKLTAFANTGLTFLTINEKRAALGFDDIDGGDELPALNPPVNPQDQQPDSSGKTPADPAESSGSTENGVNNDKNKGSKA